MLSACVPAPTEITAATAEPIMPQISGKPYFKFTPTDIGGLKVKAPVKASGVVVGRVSSIQLDPKTYRANVSLNIDSQYRFSTDVSAEILTSGLLGEQYIGLQQGAEETELKNGDTIEITSSALVLEQLIGKFMTNTVEKNGTTQ